MPDLRLEAKLLVCIAGVVFGSNWTTPARADETFQYRPLLSKYCLACHDSSAAKGELDLTTVLNEDITKHAQIWEKVVRRLSSHEMPPAGEPRPNEQEYAVIVSQLESILDRAAKDHPRPGRTSTIRRLNRNEYQNAIRDLLDVEIDASAFLPADEASHGFDNVTVGELSPVLLDRYINAAQHISRLAVGGIGNNPGGDTIRVRPDITQEDRIEGLPFGTRGGALIRYTFPRDGTYDFQLRLTRNRNEQVEGLTETHDVELLLDRELIKSFSVSPPEGGLNYQAVDQHLKTRTTISAGQHEVGVTFVKTPSSLQETLRQPYNSHFNMHRHPRMTPALFQVTITGPYESNDPGQSSSRRRIFIVKPQNPDEEEPCARQIITRLMKRAYRRPVDSTDADRLLAYYRQARQESDFEGGIEAAISALLVSREFLFRVEQDPAGITPKTAYPVSNLDLASRLSFFLWSSIPDEELIESAARDELTSRERRQQQTRRMLSDDRSMSIVHHFGGQWLYLRNLESITPDGRLFPDFDHNLRVAFRRETELLFEEIVRDDRSVLDFLKTDHAWLNERLAKHYGIPHIYGPHFRRIKLDPDTHRGGLLRQGSILTLTSYATRTSPVVRGKWILENLMGSPPPPPPPNVPALEDNTVSVGLPLRERLSQHRSNAACMNCHKVIDPVGFALENFDAIGRWRTMDEGQPVDVSGGLPDGTLVSGPEGLETGLIAHPEIFVRTLTEKLLTFALGRGIDYDDAPAVREIVRSARDKDYRFSAIIDGIVNSSPFLMRSSP